MIFVEVITEGGKDRGYFLLDENCMVRDIMVNLREHFDCERKCVLMADATHKMILNPMLNLYEQGVVGGHTLLLYFEADKGGIS